MNENLTLQLSSSPSFVRGEFFFVNLELSNTGKESIRINARLNLYEGDLIFDATDPAGNTAELRGHIIVDSMPDFVELEPGKSISASVNVFYSNKGNYFSSPGEYQLRAKYFPGSKRKSIESNPLEIQIVAESTPQEATLSALTLNHKFGQAISLSDASGDDAAVETLKQIIEVCPKSRAAIVARIALIKAEQSADQMDTESATNALMKHLSESAKSRSTEETAQSALSVTPPTIASDAEVLKAVYGILDASSSNEKAMKIKNSMRQIWK